PSPDLLRKSTSPKGEVNLRRGSSSTNLIMPYETSAGVLRGRDLKAAHDEAHRDLCVLRDRHARDSLSRALCLRHIHGPRIHAGRSHPHFPQSGRAELFVSADLSRFPSTALDAE